MNRENLQHKFPTGREAFGILLITFFMYFVCIAAFGGSINKLYILLLEIIFILPTLLYVWKRRYPFFETFRFRKVPLVWVLLSADLGIGLCVLNDFADRFVQSIIPMPESIVHALKAYMSFHSAREAVLVLFTVVFVAGIVEEMLFRGFLQNIIERRGEILKSIFVPAFVFSVFHFNPWGALQIFTIGSVFGIISWKTRSIVPSIVAHGVHNGIAAILFNLSSNAQEWYARDNSIRPFWIAIAIGMTAIGLFLLFHLTSSIKREKI